MYVVSFLVDSLPAYMLAVVSQIEFMVLSVKFESWWAAGVHMDLLMKHRRKSGSVSASRLRPFQ